MSLIIGGLAPLFYQVEKSMRNDAEAMRKNAKAATKIADAESKAAYIRQQMADAITINAKRKNGILTCHFKLFFEQCEIMKKMVFLKKGKGIEELDRLGEIQSKYDNYIKLPAVSNGRILTDTQTLVSFALRGLGGMMINESKTNLQLASRNMSQANAVSAQLDSVCIAMDAVTQHTRIVTELLEKLGMFYIKSINNIKEILKSNGVIEDNYTDNDIDAINLSFVLTKLIYRIINTPLVDNEGEIEKESLAVIREGQQLLNSIK